jgi:hypothetical protein
LGLVVATGNTMRGQGGGNEEIEMDKLHCSYMVGRCTGAVRFETELNY